MMSTSSRFILGLFVFGAVFSVAQAGTLDPPPDAFDGNEPKANMKTLNEIEPRNIILSLPYNITEPGAYYLGKNMIGSSNNVGIVVECSDVQIDLNGFALIGTNGSLDGIRVVGTNENITVRNGSIRKWGKFGINGKTADDGAVIDIKSNRNGLGGIVYGKGALIENCSVYGNGYAADLPPSYAQTNPDTDGDMMDDAWEMQIVDFDTNDTIYSIWDVYDYGAYPWGDFDNDAYSNKDEFDAKTDPCDPNDHPGGAGFQDVDFDGMEDSWEMVIVNADTNDTIEDIWDVMEWGTNIWGDFDGDLAENRMEYDYGTDPTNAASFPSIGATQTEYAAYTEPMQELFEDEFEDPTDEPNDDGIRTGAFATIKNCKSRGNRGSGILVRYASRIIDCTGAANYTDGIHVTDYCSVIGSIAARNRKDGITIGSKSVVRDNNCGQNGDFTMQNQAMPMGAGIRILGSGNRVENNNLSGNAIGIQVDNMFYNAGAMGGGNLIIGNSSVDNWGGAFDLATGDYMGGAYYQGDVGDANNTTNALMDVNNPFSNFTY